MRSTLPFALFLLALATACKTEPPVVVPGPEERALVQGLSGNLLLREDKRTGRDIDVYSFPDGRHREWNLETGADSLCGPDAEGRILYNSNRQSFFRFSGKEISYHQVRVAWLDGRPETVLVDEDNWMWSRGDLALSATGGWVAVVTTKERRQFLTIIHLECGTRRDLEMQWGDRGGLSWLRDGKSLVYGRSIPWQDAPPALRPPEPVKDAEGREESVYLLYLLDLEKEEERPLCRGGGAVPVPGQSLFVAADDDGWFAFDVEKGERIRPSRPLPGAWGSGLIAALDADRVLYVGLPTEGAKIRYYIPNSFTWVARPTIKIADLSSGKFATVVRNIKPSIGSYGP